MDKNWKESKIGKYAQANSLYECRSVVKTFQGEAFLIDEKGNKLFGPFKEIRRGGFSGYYRVKDKSGVTGYMSMDHKWLCQNCNGSAVYYNLAWVRDLRDPESRGYRLMDETGTFLTDFAVKQYNRSVDSYAIWRMSQGMIYIPLSKHPSGYHEIWINPQHRIIWPPAWDDPCTDTSGMIIWPDGACKNQ